MINRNCLIIGSGSNIGESCAYVFAKNGFNIILAARAADDYQIRLSQDIRIRFGVIVENITLDVLDFGSHDSFWNNLTGQPDVVISLVGYLGDQKRSEGEFSETYKVVATNYLGIISLFNSFVNSKIARRDLVLIVFSSVAGERGRKSNYIYGSAKAGLTAYLGGLRNSLYPQGIHVMTVLPGFMATKMTEHLKLPKNLTASPDNVAQIVYNSYLKKRDIVYVFPIWRLIMFVIKNIPERIFKRLNL